MRLDVEAVPDQGERDLLVLGGRLPRVGLRGQVARVEVAVVADVAALAHRAEQAAVHQEGLEAEVVVEHRADPGVEVHHPALPGGVEPLGELEVALLGQHPALVEALAELGRGERPVALGEAVHPVPGDRQRPAVDPDGDPGALAEVGPDAADPEHEGPDLAGAAARGLEHRRVRGGVRRGEELLAEHQVHPHRRGVRGHRDPALDELAREGLDDAVEGLRGRGARRRRRVPAPPQSLDAGHHCLDLCPSVHRSTIPHALAGTVASVGTIVHLPAALHGRSGAATRVRPPGSATA